MIPKVEWTGSQALVTIVVPALVLSRIERLRQTKEYLPREEISKTLYAQRDSSIYRK